MNDIYSLGPLWFDSIDRIDVSAFLLALVAFFISVKFAAQRLAAESPNRFKLIVLLNIVAMIGLGGFIFKPKTQTHSIDSVQLITPGEIVATIDGNRPTYWLTPTQEQIKKYHIRFNQQLLSIGQLNQRVPYIDTLVVYGDGLDANAWDKVSASRVQFKSTPLKTGIIDAQWRTEINLGEFLSVSGKLQVPRQKTNMLYKVALVDPAGEEVDTAIVRSGDFFTLADRPKLFGNHLYHLAIRSNERENNIQIVSEKINVSVKKATGLSMMVLESSPSFETRQIQEWATRNGASVLVKTQMSKDRYITRAINREKPASTPLSVALLSQFDLLVADARIFALLSNEQLDAIQEAITQGMGLIVLADYSLFEKNNQTHWLRKLFGINETLNQPEDSNLKPIYWFNDNAEMVSVKDLFLPVIQAEFTNQTELSALVFDERGVPLMASRSYGQGKVAVSLVRETFRWVNNEALSLYSHYWQTLFKRLARLESKRAIDFGESGNQVYAGGMLRVCVGGESDSDLYWHAHKNVESILLQSLAQFRLVNCGIIWPRESGWKKISNLPTHVNANESESNTKNSKVESLERSVYVHSSDSWQAQRQKERQDATLGKIAQSSHSDNRLKKVLKPISHWIFGWIFIASAGLIWWERKQFDDTTI